MWLRCFRDCFFSFSFLLVLFVIVVRTNTFHLQYRSRVSFGLAELKVTTKQETRISPCQAFNLVAYKT
ncbi:hypothetical protein DM02DRAFT_610206 [Periconia macrospinosa]|uniref:Uncharacterized protein n=1 Tax=Periconia macrospinosa TaxID=97972 RepID=A0A2V1E5I3_9PLEO|nr:hypothetical protein DM02DRAFT_610206 [Periconia macrospinosa]